VALPMLLQQRGWSQNELARRTGVDATFLSRALRGVRHKSISGSLAGRIAEALDLPVDFFPEFRRDFVVERIEADPRLLEDVYAWIRRRERAL
jgi:transcriptional regulator with XRE-family HTH domain